MSHAAGGRFSPYDDAADVQRHVHDGNHRAVIGGLWEEMGALQLNFLKRRGLRPGHWFIDVGAGSFRAGVRLVPYLEAGHYYAIDLQESLLEAGYQREIVPMGLALQFPRENFAATARFEVAGFAQRFDFGIAQSVFTHMPIARLNDCLAALAPHFRVDGQFFVTVFLVPEVMAGRAFTQVPGGTVTMPGADPFHTTLAALDTVTARAPEWGMEIIGGWGHPRNQQMVCFRRR